MKSIIRQKEETKAGAFQTEECTKIFWLYLCTGRKISVKKGTHTESDL